MGITIAYNPLKLKLFFPIAFFIILVIAIATMFFIRNSIKTFDAQIEENLKLEVKTISKMFERERQLKLEKSQTNLKVAHNLFYNQNLELTDKYITVRAKNQLNNDAAHDVQIQQWMLDKELLYGNFTFVDSIQNLLGGTVTIFQKIDSGYLRVSTNVLNGDGSRAVDTYIPNSSPVIKAVEQKNIYYGRAFVVNSWYITAYEPIIKNEQVIGILYVGYKEKDLQKLREILYSLKIGESGYPFVFDKDGIMLIHPYIEGENWKDSSLFRQFTIRDEGVINYQFRGKDKIAAYKYYPDFEFYIVASIEAETETNSFVNRTVLTSLVIALITIFFLLAILYFLTADRIYKYFIQLDISKKELITAQEELKQSEDRFQKLFNSTGDDIYVTDSDENIVEVNQAICNTLGYSRKELLGKKMVELKTPKYAPLVAENRRKIYELGTYTFESEHIAKDGKIVQIETTSRVVEYKKQKLILSVARNIGLRKETEREILSTVIRTEERERERFAKDMHDSVGPLLSTIKLYVNELKSPILESQERNEFVNQTNEILDEAINSIRTISNNLMPRVINKYGLIKALESFTEKVNKTNAINIEFVKKNVLERLDQNLELILFRVISELINNTIKHAQAKNIKIELEKGSDKMIMNFMDDGIGFNIEEIMRSDQKGMGLKNIISRIKSINGYYEFTSLPDKGFKISVNIDL